ncbi:MAG: PAS domain-containing sensor histidine kinase [Chlamydiales bacterium]|nr:PAS domain-containing sensor histidine kinase [Chlamydiales bacterium]
MSCPFFHKKEAGFWHKIKNRLFPSSLEEEALSIENLRAILDTTVDGVVTINEESIILVFNKSAEKMFGYTKEEAIGKEVTMLMPEPFRSEHNRYVHNYITTGKAKIIGIGREATGRRKDGTIFPIDLAVSEVIVKNKRLFTGIICNITNKKIAEALIREDVAWEAAIKAKNEQMAILGHELRTPLTSIHGALGLILIDKDLSAKMKELLSVAYRSSSRLNTIINDIVDIGKIQAGKLKMEFKPTPIGKIIKESIAVLKEMACNFAILVVERTPYPDSLVFIDENRMIQVMTNLLSNAIKNSPAHTEVSVSVQIIDNNIRICISDQGKGIPQEEKKNIFTPFFQIANHDARLVGGTGLGLYICKTIVEQLNGRIGFMDNGNKGTTFYVDLPIYKGLT